MDEFRIEVRVTGEEGNRRVLVGLAERAENLTPVFRAWAKDFNRIEMEQFDTRGGRGGMPWAPLARGTVMYKLRKGQNPAALRATDQLYNSLTKWPAKRAVRRVGKGVFEIGTMDEKAGFHQGGTRRMPARPIVVLTKEDRLRWLEMLNLYVSTGKVVPI